MALEAVDDYARRTLDLASRMGARRAEGLAACLLGESQLLRGQWNDAEEHLRRALEVHRSLGASTGEALASQRLAELAVYRGDADSAAAHLERGLDLAVEGPLPEHLLPRIYATMALNALERDEPEAACAAIEAAELAAAHYGTCPPCEALLHPVAAEAYAAVGALERARSHAAAAAEAGSWGSDAWRAMAAVAQAAIAPSKAERANRMAEAAETFARQAAPAEAGAHDFVKVYDVFSKLL
ncbi:MAG: tetratricopeptide repeat protein, partial [Chloroflexi bacterium]|nr:tetratricopeptide repeat protein [Chloroflexota bacterium]